jgi:hypothetical protein
MRLFFAGTAYRSLPKAATSNNARYPTSGLREAASLVPKPMFCGFFDSPKSPHPAKTRLFLAPSWVDLKRRPALGIFRLSARKMHLTKKLMPKQQSANRAKSFNMKGRSHQFRKSLARRTAFNFTHFR